MRAPVQNLFHALRTHSPKAPAITDLTTSVPTTYTYAALLYRATHLRDSFTVPPSQPHTPSRVAILTNPTSAFVTSLLATWASKAAAVPLSPLYPPAALRPLLQDTSPSLILAERETLASLPDTASGTLHEVDKHIHPHLRDVDEPEKTETFAPLCETLASTCASTPRDTAFLLFTSGTTGRAKGVVWTHAMLTHHVKVLSSAWRWSSSDKILNVLPLHHVHGLVNVVLTALYSGAHVEMHPSFDANKVWQAFLRHPNHEPAPPTVFMAVPAVYAKLIHAYEQAGREQQIRMREASARLRLFVCGSASLSKQHFEAWYSISGHRILERYGMTETGMTLSNHYDTREQGLLGYPLPGVETQIQADGDDPHQGELLVRGPGVFQEYWQQPDATRAVFTEDSWFQTGDVVKRNPSTGTFTMLGRASSDIIKTGGYKVSALEIENVLRACSHVKDCSVVGVEDKLFGQAIVAALILHDGDNVVDAIKTWAMQHLPKYKVPRRFLVVDDFPRNVLGKVQKQLLKSAVQ